MWNFMDKLVLMGCGYTANKHVISEINIDNEHVQKDTYIAQVKEKVHSMCQVRSKKYDILSIVTGSDDGIVNIFPYPLADNPSNSPWETVKSHRSVITNIAYSRDTNLIFSTGDDGNLFIYCLYELPDGENIAFDDNKMTNLNQLTSILDEGLGDNVLYPLNSIFRFEDKIYQQSLVIAEDKQNKSKLIKDQQGKIKEFELKMTRQREQEIRALDDKLKELKINKDATMDHYEEKIQALTNENNRILIEKEQAFNNRMDQMSNSVHDLTSQVHLLKSQHDIEMKKKDDEYERKFRDLENELRKKFEELKLTNDDLGNELNHRQKMEELKFVHLDQEHEQEITYKIEHYEKMLAFEMKTRHENQSEINALKDQKLKLEQEKVEKENENKKLTEELERLVVYNTNLKSIIDKKDKENDEIKKKLKRSEESLQEKTVLAGFSSKLKNELYRKGNEIMSGYNKQQMDIQDLKSNSKNIEKELEDSLRLLEHYEKELTKQKILIDELKNKCDEERKTARMKENELDNLLQKVYDTFQTNDKNKIIAGIRKIYTIYLTDDKVKKIDSSKLNVNIRDELEKQIDFLQRALGSNMDLKGKRESIQNMEINKRTDQNSLLIEELNKNRKNFTQLEKEYRKLKSDHSALAKKVENYYRIEQENALKAKDLNLPQIKQSQEINKDEVYNMHSNNVSIQTHKNSGKLYKGITLSKRKGEADVYKLSEIMKTIEEKNSIIFNLKKENQKLNIEINRINNTQMMGMTNTSNNFSSVVKINNLNDIEENY